MGVSSNKEGVIDKYDISFRISCSAQSNSKERYVTSEDLHFKTTNNVSVSVSITSSSFVGSETPPIVISKITNGQILDLSGRCCMGSGRMHAKWSPVSSFTIKHLLLVMVRRDEISSLVTLLEKYKVGAPSRFQKPSTNSTNYSEQELVFLLKSESKNLLSKVRVSSIRAKPSIKNFIVEVESSGSDTAKAIIVKSLD